MLVQQVFLSPTPEFWPALSPLAVLTDQANPAEVATPLFFVDKVLFAAHSWKREEAPVPHGARRSTRSPLFRPRSAAGVSPPTRPWSGSLAAARSWSVCFGALNAA
eukprot:14102738-Alexandrium_andersonii.AAC.1